MTQLADSELRILVVGVLGILVMATAAGSMLSRRAVSGAARATAENIRARLRAWWVMAALFVCSISLGSAASMLLFGLVSFLALREFVTLAPTRIGDHRALFWSFFIVTPIQYYLVWTGWYGLFTILIPVYVSILLAIRTVLAGDTERFMERTAVHQWGLMICVYFVSHVPAVLTLRLSGDVAESPKLMLYLVLVVQLSDVLQYVWGRTVGRHPVAPSISPNKTWEGLVGGIVCSTALGTAIWWATPFSVAQAACMSLAITVMGFAGGLVMSAIKRDRGVKDYGAMIAGHGGVLDRIDSLCFSAPVFFHLTRYFYAS